MDWLKIGFEILIGIVCFLAGYQTAIKLARGKIQEAIDNIKKGKLIIRS